MAVTTGILIATAAAGAYLSAEQAKQQNRAVRRSQDAASRSANLQAGQVASQAALERQKRIREGREALGRLRALNAEGVGTEDALERQIAADVGTNLNIVNINASNQIARVRSGEQADLIALQGRRQNTFLAGLSGGISGFNTGLSIAGAVGEYGRLTGSVSGDGPEEEVYDESGGADI